MAAQKMNKADGSVRQMGLPAALAAAGAVVVLAALAASVGWGEDGPVRYETIHLADERFEVELALTRSQQSRGMAGREQIAPDEGMLFVFKRQQRLSFWMKGCLIPLDIIFVDASGRIVQTHTMPAPDPDASDWQLESYSSRYPAQFAIEVKAGTVERLGLEEGQRVDISIERLKRLAAGVDESEEEEEEAEAEGASSAGSGEHHASATDRQSRGRF